MFVFAFAEETPQQEIITGDVIVGIFEKGEDTGFDVYEIDLEQEYNYYIQAYSQQADFDPIFDGIFLKFELANLKVQRKLLDYYAFKKRLTINELQLEEEANNTLQEISPDPETKSQIELQYGNLDNFYEFIKLNYRKEMMRQAAMDNIAPVTDEAMKVYFDSNTESLLSEYEQVSAKHIIVETEETANEILQKINSGELTFDEAAAEYSFDTQNKDNGGDLGFFKRNEMVDAFSNAAFNAEIGKIAGPVQSDYGFHLILVTGKKTLNSYEDLKALPEYEDIKADVQTAQIQNWMPIYLKNEKIEFVFRGAMKAINDFSKLYLESNQTQDFSNLIDYALGYIPDSTDGVIFLDVALESIMSRIQAGMLTVLPEMSERILQKRLENLKILSLVQETSLAALSKYYALNPADSKMAIRFFGKYIEQALDLFADPEIVNLYGDSIKDQIKQAIPGLLRIAEDITADKRDRVVAYTYIIRVNKISEDTGENKALVEKILELDPENIEALNLLND